MIKTKFNDIPRKERIPKHIRIKPPTDPEYYKVKERLKELKLHTVCEEARCPNASECWSAGTATIMILGDTCTRHCKFCNVKTGNPQGLVDQDEPRRVAMQVAGTSLKYIVITCVDRDDLPDGGARIFAETMTEMRQLKPKLKIESLISDYAGNKKSLKTLLEGSPDVLAHNIETVKRLTPTIRDRRASYKQSLGVLEHAKEIHPNALTKSSIMVGLGESLEEVLDACRDLKKVGVDIVTLGQYLRPSLMHHPVERYYTPEEFKILEEKTREMGFLYVASGALVRSSYRASELFIHGYLDKRDKKEAREAKQAHS